jgi:hypothetical protein
MGGISLSQINPALNGRKLSPRTLKTLRISSKFIDEAKNLIFMRDNLSFVPMLNATPNGPAMAAVTGVGSVQANQGNLAGLYNSSSSFGNYKNSLTLAEMALMPPAMTSATGNQQALALPSIKHRERGHSKKVKSSSIMSTSMSSIGWASQNQASLEDFGGENATMND